VFFFFFFGCYNVFPRKGKNDRVCGSIGAVIDTLFK